MLIQFKCANHRSIKEEVKFSLLASTDDSLSENLIVSDTGNKYLRCAEIYGANGSGKSTLLNAIQMMSAIVQKSNNHQPGDKIIRTPHKLSLPNTPTVFSIIFIKNGVKYSYGFSYTEEGILEEYLYYWPGRKKAMIFERTQKSDFEFGDGFKKNGENCRGRIKNNKLLLSCAANETSIKEITEVFLFFKEDLVIYPGEPNNWFEYSVSQIQNNQEMKNLFINFMNSIGSDLVDIKAKIEQRTLTQKELAIFGMQTLPFPIQQLSNQKVNIINLKLDYGKFVIDINEESAGVRKLFKFLCPLIDILHSGKVFICDEIETHLHPSIVAEIVKRFCKNIDSDGQMILTTHDTDLLDLDYVRRDQIWFTELKPEFRSTDLYSLIELKSIRKGENVKKGYISGRYGAVPMLNGNFREDENAKK